ncbi:uncharacterized protein LOC119996334 isoform X1 [Tripterygium wilfordii]|uniref:uncharacterized protein LOC119996334 isoform X1 n=1 Tax=Tripterygium wilfordii TaxID=458696 RepID=UPI0018F7EB29|nr:uncharacterized protein LOC119996334 isoform X1 [Tripterygium wilfordii]
MSMPVMDSPMVDVNNNKVKPKKSENYTVQEDLILIAAWEHTSEDAITGTDQAKEQYWIRVWREYSENAKSYPPRSDKSIVNRFSVIRTKCLKFSGIVQSIENAHPSGMGEKDKLNEALKTWALEEKEKSFKLLHCYNVLKNSHKWMTEVVLPTSRRNIPASAECYTIGDDDIPSGHVEPDRPIGRKAEKELRRKKKMKVEDSEESTASVNFRHSQEMLQKRHDQRMEVVVEDTKKMDELMEMKREKIRLDQEWREEKLMTVDMTNLSEMQRKFVEMKQKKIFERYFSK